MKILLLADEEVKSLYDYYQPGRLSGYELILSAGDLKGEYLTFIETMANKPLVYVHGNHDTRYDVKPPEGCICADDDLVVAKGVRILGLGGTMAYNGGRYQYTEDEMEKRIRKLERKIRLAGGVDIVLTHAAPMGLGDAEDHCHRGFEAFLALMKKYKPVYLVHGHTHLNYGMQLQRIHHYDETTIINAYEKHELDVTVPMKTAEEDDRILKEAASGVIAVTDRLKITGKDSLLYSVYTMVKQMNRQ